MMIFMMISANEIFFKITEHPGLLCRRFSGDRSYWYNLSFPLTYLIAQVVGLPKSISVSKVFEKFKEVKKEL